jgi:hypothetical protein
MNFTYFRKVWQTILFLLKSANNQKYSKGIFHETESNVFH